MINKDSIIFDEDKYWVAANLTNPVGKAKSFCMIDNGRAIEIQLLDDINGDEGDGEVIKTITFKLEEIAFMQALYNFASEHSPELRWFKPVNDRVSDKYTPELMEIARKYYNNKLSLAENNAIIRKKRIVRNGRRFQFEFLSLATALHMVRAELVKSGVECVGYGSKITI